MHAVMPICALLLLASCVRSSSTRERFMQARDARVRGQAGNQTIAYFPELDRLRQGNQSVIVTVDLPPDEGMPR